MKYYDPVLCMMVEDNSVKTNDAAYSVSYRSGNGPYQSIGVIANSENEAIDKVKKHFESRKKEAEIFGASIGESLETMKRKGKPIIDSSSVKDASRGHEIIVKTENYLRSLGKNNSTGRYDRVVRGVKSLLEQGFLEGPELERAIKQEADRLLKKYNPNDALDKAIRTADAKSLSQVYNDGMKAMTSAMDLKNPEKARVEVDKIFMDTINDMNDVVNEMQRQLSKLRDSLSSRKQELNKMLFAAYRNMNK